MSPEQLESARHDVWKWWRLHQWGKEGGSARDRRKEVRRDVGGLERHDGKKWSGYKGWENLKLMTEERNSCSTTGKLKREKGQEKMMDAIVCSSWYYLTFGHQRWTNNSGMHIYKLNQMRQVHKKVISTWFEKGKKKKSTDSQSFLFQESHRKAYVPLTWGSEAVVFVLPVWSEVDGNRFGPPVW